MYDESRCGRWTWSLDRTLNDVISIMCVFRSTTHKDLGIVFSGNVMWSPHFVFFLLLERTWF